jgi:ParB/RepB/Spo0J family partition protein
MIQNTNPTLTLHRPLLSDIPETYVRADELDYDHINPRTTNRPDQNLRNQILSIGIMHPLIVRTTDTPKLKITAGKRRYSEIKRLIDDHLLPDDFKIAVKNIGRCSDEIAIIFAHAENNTRSDLDPIEEIRAAADAAARGYTADQIASLTGLDITTAKRRLALANLASPILAALAENKLSIEQAKAYATNPNRDAQLKFFKHKPHASPQDIRHSLAQAKIAGHDPRARLVGANSYLEAGGTIESDLFGNPEDITWNNAALLEQIAHDTLLHIGRAAANGQNNLDIEVITQPLSRRDLSEFELLKLPQPQDIQTPNDRRRLKQAIDSAIDSQSAYEACDDPLSETADILRRAAIADRVKLDALYQTLTVPAAQPTYLLIGLDPNGLPELRRAIRRAISPITETNTQHAPAFLEPKPVRAQLRDTLNAAAAMTLTRSFQTVCALLLHDMILRQKAPATPKTHYFTSLTAAPQDHDTSEMLQTAPGHREHEDARNLFAQAPIESISLWNWVVDLPERRLQRLFAYVMTNQLAIDPSMPAFATFAQSLQFEPSQAWQPTYRYYWQKLPKKLILEILNAIAPDDARNAKSLNQTQLALLAEKVALKADWMPYPMQKPAYADPGSESIP